MTGVPVNLLVSVEMAYLIRAKNVMMAIVTITMRVPIVVKPISVAIVFSTPGSKSVTMAQVMVARVPEQIMVPPVLRVQRSAA
jgi:hypothetical protein